MTRIPHHFQLFACVSALDHSSFPTMIAPSIAPYSDTHQAWFLVLWHIWQQSKEGQYIEAWDSDSPVDPVRLEATIRAAWTESFPSLPFDSGYRKNIESDICREIRQYLGTSRYQAQSLAVEKDALFAIMRAGQHTLYTYYLKRFIKLAEKEKIQDSTYFAVIQHMVDIHLEYVFRHLPQTGPSDRKALLIFRELVTRQELAARVAEKGLNALNSGGELDPLHRAAFEYLTLIADPADPLGLDRQPLGNLFSTCPKVSSADILSALYRLHAAGFEDPAYLGLLQEAMNICDRSMEKINPDLGTNVLFLLNNLIVKKLNEKDDQLREYLDLRIKLHELVLAHELATGFPVEFFNLVNMYFWKIDMIYGRHRAMGTDAEEGMRQEVKEVIDQVRHSLPQLLLRVPKEFRSGAELQMRLCMAFHEEDPAQFNRLKTRVLQQNHFLHLFDVSGAWHIMKMAFKTLPAATFSTMDEEALVNDLRNFERRIKRIHEPDAEKFLARHVSAAKAMIKFLVARSPVAKSKVLTALETTPHIQDKEWLCTEMKRKC